MQYFEGYRLSPLACSKDYFDYWIILNDTDYPNLQNFAVFWRIQIILPSLLQWLYPTHPMVPGYPGILKSRPTNAWKKRIGIWCCLFLTSLSLKSERDSSERERTVAWFWSKLQEWPASWVISHMKRHHLDQWPCYKTSWHFEGDTDNKNHLGHQHQSHLHDQIAQRMGDHLGDFSFEETHDYWPWSQTSWSSSSALFPRQRECYNGRKRSCSATEAGNAMQANAGLCWE